MECDRGTTPSVVAGALFVASLLYLTACADPPRTTEAAKIKPVRLGVDRQHAQGTLPGPCERYLHEYTGLYPIIDTLPTITEDSISMDTLLKSMGMRYVTAGWGNWEKGPRIFSMTLAMDACTCQVHKAYFYHTMHADSTWDMRVVERVVCNVPDSLVPWWTDE